MCQPILDHFGELTLQTPLDQAHAGMMASPQDDHARLRFYERLADAELFLMLAEEPDGDRIVPETFELSDGTYVLAFDREERLAAFATRPVPYAILSGRSLAKMLAGQGLGLGVNFGALSEHLLSVSSLEWLVGKLSEQPKEIEARPVRFHAPTDLPAKLLEALNAKLSSAVGMADTAWLGGVTYDTNAQSHVIAFVGPVPGAQPALVQAVSEALIFSGLDAGAIDVIFFTTDDPALGRLAKVGVRLDIPKPAVANTPQPPGMDPKIPPKLR